MSAATGTRALVSVTHIPQRQRLRSRGGLLGALAMLGCLALACEDASSRSAAAVAEAGRPAANLIVISIDTLRADRLGSYGYDRPTSPAMDALARRGTRFASAIAESNWTLPSHLTLFTGLHPTTHGVTVKGRLPASTPTLAEVLRTAGFRAFAYTGGGFVKGSFGFQRGFEVYRDERERSFAETLRLAKRKIRSLRTDTRYFLFLHTYAIHCPYDPPEHYAEMFRTRPREDRIETGSRCGAAFDEMKLSPGQVRFLSDQYDAGIRWVDDSLADFIRFLDSRGELEKTVLVLVSDHGEEFYEHGRIGHRKTLHVESLEVPFLLVAPGVTPRVVGEPVGLADVMPTVLDLLGVPAPEVQGRSLVPLLRGQAVDWPRRAMFSELDKNARLRSVIDRDHHLIWDLETDDKHLFDLRTDPTEQRRLASDEAGHGAALEKLLADHLSAQSAPSEVPAAQLSDKDVEQLRALGYVD